MGSTARSGGKGCVLGGPLIAGLVLVVACHRDDAASATASGGGATEVGASCATPNEGCPCTIEAETVACGRVETTSADGWVSCAVGSRTCSGGAWGGCVVTGDTKTTSYFASSGGLKTMGYGTLLDGGACPSTGSLADACNPYCQQYADTAPGITATGFTVSDGGLVIAPNADGGSTVNAWISTAGGLSSCTAANVVASSCTYPGYAQCQQDFHCDAATSKCLWNGGTGYYDPAAGGADLTVGAPCGDSGSATATVPVCNRGSAAVPAGAVLTFHVTGGTTAPDGCTSLGAPTTTRTLSAALDPGACVSFTVGNSAGEKTITINAGAPGAVTEATGRCANNSAAFKTDGAACATCTACTTTLKGNVYDPSASAGSTGNGIKLAGVTVFQPSKALTTFAALPTCDSCSSLSTDYVSAAVTDANGAFTLSGVSPGTAVPIVVQSGRWRRMITVPISQCVANDFTTAALAGTFHMPKSRTDGYGSVADIPKIAISTGNHDPLECLLVKIGIASSEIKSRQSSADANRFQLYRENGMTTASPTPPAASQLWNGTVNIGAEYSAILMGCEQNCMSGSGTGCTALTAAQKTVLGNYANAGGRLFLTHGTANPVIGSGAPLVAATTSWSSSSAGTSLSTAKGRIASSTTAQTLFRDWMANNAGSAYYGSPYVRVDAPWQFLYSVASTSTEWIRGDSTNAWIGSGNYTLSMSFETPIASTSTCGRVVFGAMHTSTTRVTGAPIVGGWPSTSGLVFPTACNTTTALTEEERALEYQLFQLTACALGGAPTPPDPPPPPPLAATTFTRDFQAVCPSGSAVRWTPFYWEAEIPSGTSIGFRAATADTQADLALEGSIATVGTATSTTAASSWDCTGCPAAPVTVNSQLLAQAGMASKAWLRISMDFQPTGQTSPVLYAWRQLYDCIPNE